MSRTVTVIGGGAAGLSAAIAAARCGAEVRILERLPRVGKKILLTGNGRCNLGHAGFDAARYHGTLPQANAILQRFDTAAYFRQLGVYTRTDAEGRMYPYSGTAASVLDALRFAAEQYGVQTVCDSQVTALTHTQKGWRIGCGDRRHRADAVVIAAGGSAAPSCGTDGSLLPLLREMGHTVITPKPSLCPIPTDPARVRALKGLRVRAAAAALLGDTALKTETGEVQFTERALSGICIFNLSRLAAMHGKRMQIKLDLMPDQSAEESAAILAELVNIRAALPCGDLLSGLLPKRIGEVCMKQAFGTVSTTSGELLRDAASRERLCALLRDWRFPVTGMASFAQAQVTAGGIAGQNVTRQLASKVQPALYFCGEILDLDGDCGGYNLAWAWASGETAGSAAAFGRT